ncbi:flagellar export chaperone FliS, partial [Paenibacillus xylanexedens]|uniref:flagellar export chaperone FliS n=1 Tax=Paenibacillus xylanexedens TaxID=528191 RepID=UPI0011A8D3C8
INLAKHAIENKEIEQRNTNIQKAQNIISELMLTLNMDVEISKNMRSLYEYPNRRLIEANIKQDSTTLEEVEGIITEFRDVWKQVIQLN